MGSLPAGSVGVCMCVRGGGGVQTRDVEKVMCRGCTQAELCGPGPDKYVHRVDDLCTLFFLCRDHFRSTPADLIGPLSPASLCTTCIVGAQMLTIAKLRYMQRQTSNDNERQTEEIFESN